jgi:hypothetical protein
MCDHHSIIIIDRLRFVNAISTDFKGDNRANVDSVILTASKFKRREGVAEIKVAVVSQGGLYYPARSKNR